MIPAAQWGSGRIVLRAPILERTMPLMTTTKATRFLTTLIADLEYRASRTLGTDRARLLAAAEHYRTVLALGRRPCLS